MKTKELFYRRQKKRIEEARRSGKHLNPDAQEARREKSGVKEQSGLHNKTLSQNALGMRVCSCV